MLRPTWHHVRPADLRWLQTLTSPRVHATSATMYRRYGLDGPTLARATDVSAGAVADHRYATRAELAGVLAGAGLPLTGLALIHALMHAELATVLCSGPVRAGHQTYGLVDERAPDPGWTAPDRDAALAELARR